MSAITPGKPRTMQMADRRPPGQRNQAVTPNIDPIRIIRRHLVAIIGSVFVGLALGTVAHFGFSRFYPLYTGEVLFELQPGIQDPTKVGTREITREDLLERLARTQTVLLVSREVLVRAMEHPDITRATTWHEWFVDKDGIFDIQEAVDELEEDLKTPIIRGTNLFALRWTTHVNTDIPIVLNAITRAYENKRKSLDDEAVAENMRVFSGRRSDAEASLRDINSRIQQFIIEHGLTTLDDPRFGPIAQGLDDLTREITENKSTLSLARSAYAQVQLKLEGTLEPNSEDMQNAEADPLITQLNANVDRLRTEHRARMFKFNPGHPEIQRIEDEVRAAEEERDSRLNEIILRNLEARRKILSDTIESVITLLEQLEEEAEEKDRLLRERSADHSEYQAMETERKHMEEARKQHMEMINELLLMRLRVDANRVRVAQRAIPPRKPSFPKMEIMIPLGALLCLGLTVGVIFLRELTDQRVKSTSDLEVLPNAVVLGSIPDLEDDPTRAPSADRVVSKHPNSILAESYRQFCTTLGHAIESHGYQSIMFVCGLPGAGATTAVTNVASVIAASGKSVVVIDGDFRRSRLASAYEKEESGKGFGDLLIDKATLDDALVTIDDGISLISAGTPANRVIERLNNGRFESILAELRSRFDIILIDTPPAVVAGDAMALANCVDSAVLVVRANREQRGLVARIIRQFDDSPCHLVGLLLNRPLETAGGYFKKNYAVMAKYGMGKSV